MDTILFELTLGIWNEIYENPFYWIFIGTFVFLVLSFAVLRDGVIPYATREASSNALGKTMAETERNGCK